MVGVGYTRTGGAFPLPSWPDWAFDDGAENTAAMAIDAAKDTKTEEGFKAMRSPVGMEEMVELWNGIVNDRCAFP